MERYWARLNGGQMPITEAEWHLVAHRHQANVESVRSQLVEIQCDMIRRRLLRH